MSQRHIQQFHRFQAAWENPQDSRQGYPGSWALGKWRGAFFDEGLIDEVTVAIHPLFSQQVHR
jgi:hypothetical protein